MNELALTYAAVPKVNCKGKCIRACGPIEATPRERLVFERATGKPFPDPLTVLKSKHAECPYLDAMGRCEVYRDRPMICRLYGAVQGMRCPFGCVPERWLSDTEASELLKATL
jgi:Fe-S-cluster containining protein